MTAIWYDTADDRLVIQGALQTYAPRTLMALLDGDTVMVRLKVGSTNQFGPAPYTTLTDANGSGFADAASALAYLQGEFVKRPAAVTSLYLAAGEPLSGHRVVRGAGSGTVRVASSDDASQAGLILGVTTHAADEGDVVAVTAAGPIEEPSWSFAPGPVFLGLNGALIQAPPTVGFVQQIATAVTATRIVVERSAPLILAQ